MNLTPMGKRILVKEMQKEPTEGSKTTLILINKMDTPIIEGSVQAIGTDKSVVLKVSDKVIFNKYAAVKVFSEKNEELYLVLEDEILGIVNE